MALSAEQKARNREAQLERDRLFRARRREFESEKKRRIDEFHATTTFKSEKDKAFDAVEVALHERTVAEAEIQSQIAALQRTLNNVLREHDEKLEVLNAERHRTNKAYFAAKEAAEKEVDTQFEDVAGVYSAVAWGQRVKAK